MAFDPDAYLASNDGAAPAPAGPAPGFDPDAYLAAEPGQALATIPQAEADRVYGEVSGARPATDSTITATQDASQRVQRAALAGVGQMVQSVGRLADLRARPEKNLAAAFQADTRNPVSRGLADVGTAIESVATDPLNTYIDPARNRTVLAQGADIAGSVLPLMAGGMVTKPAIGAVAGGLQMGEQGARQAEAEGRNVERAYLVNTLGGSALNLLPVPGVAGASPGINRLVQNEVARRALRAGVGTGMGAVINTAGDLALQVAEGSDISTDRLVQNAAMGAGAGFVAGAASPAAAAPAGRAPAALDTSPSSAIAVPEVSPGERVPGAPSPLDAPPATALEMVRREAVASMEPEYQSVVQKYPTLLAVEGLEDGRSIPIEIRHADGTTEGAVMNGYGDALAESYGEPGSFVTKPSIGYYKPEAGGFSHTPIRPGDTIISKVPTPEQWQARMQPAEPVLLDPAAPEWLARARETAEQTINVPATLRAIEKLGKTSPAAAVDMIGQMHRQIGERNAARSLMAPTDRVRGADYVRERLLRARRTGELPEGTASFGLWLLDKNPNVADALGISVREKGQVARAAGSYAPGERLVTLFTDTANPGTAVHEILHHSERLMPKPVQEGILKEWSKATKREIDAADPVRAQALLDFMSATQTGDQAAWNRANAAMGKGVLKPSDYQLTNPSEWWAVNGTRILSARYGAEGWVAAARQWLAELVDRARGFFGGKTNAAVIAGLRGVMDGTYRGEPALGSRMLSSQMTKYMDPATPLRPLPDDALVQPLGKGETVLQGVGSAEQRWQVRLPGETGRGDTYTAAQLAEKGFLPPEPRVNLSIGGGEAEAVPVSKLPGAILAALYEQPVGPRSPAMPAQAMDQGGTSGGPISPTAIVSGPAGPPAPGSTPLKAIESARAAGATREELRQSLGAFGTTITLPEIEAAAAREIDAFPNLDAARAFVVGDNSGTPIANAMAANLFEKLQAENRLQDASDVIYNLGLKARTLGQAIRVLSLLGKSTPAGMATYATKLFGRPLTSAEIGEINAAMKRIGAAVDDEVRVSRTLDLLDRLNARSPMKAGWDEKAAAMLNIAMLLNTKTVTRNVIGNTFLASANLTADMIVPAVDAGISMFITGQRTARGPQIAEYVRGLATPGVDLMKGYRQARREGADRWPSFKEGVTVVKDMAKLVSGGHLTTGELMNTYRTVFSGWTPDGKRGGPRRAASSMLRGLENSMTVTMGTFDRAFYEARRRSSLMDMMKAAGADVPTADMVDRSLIEAATSIYQNENFLSESLRDLKRAVNWGTTLGHSRKFGAGNVLANFVQVPGSLLLEGMKFTPLGFVKPVSHALGAIFLKRQFNQRQFAQEFTKALMGTAGLVGAGAWLSSLGIISGPKETDPKIRALQKSLGFGAYQINVSALKRAYQSMDWKSRQARMLGDVFYTYDWAQPVALPVAMGASMAESIRGSRMEADYDPAQGRPAEVLGALASGTLGGARSLEEQPLLAGLTGFMQNAADARQEGMGVLEALKDSMVKLPGMFLPTAVRQVTQLMDNRVYETRGTDKLETAYQTTLANIPGLASALGYKPRADILGDLAERYQANGNTFFNVLVNPGFVTRMKDDPELRELYGIWETTGSTGQIPGRVDKKVTINGQPKVLTAPERADYQQFVGRITRDVFKQVMRSEGYQAADDAVRAKVLAQIVSAANTVAKVRLFGDRPRRVDKYDRALYGASVLNPDAEALVPEPQAK